MPYRRLPKTDQARLYALKQAVHRAGEVAFNQQAINYKTLIEAQRLLLQFENQVAQYHANFDSKVSWRILSITLLVCEMSAIVW